MQTGIIGAQGRQLLDWLNDYTYVAEQAFADEAVARDTARVFCDELLRNGTTTALVFCSVHAGSVDALFEEARARNLRLIAGKVLMDRNAPAALTRHRAIGLRPVEGADRQVAWPRPLRSTRSRRASPAPARRSSSSWRGALWREHPDVLMQTHIAENRARSPG